MKIGNYETQFKSYLKWLFSLSDLPRPSLWYPTDGWVTDPNLIIDALARDELFGFKKKDQSKEMQEWEEVFRLAWWAEEGDKPVNVDMAVVWIKNILSAQKEGLEAKYKRVLITKLAQNGEKIEATIEIPSQDCEVFIALLEEK